MAKYLFDTHYGKSSLYDEDTGILIEWDNGKFNDTQRVTIDGSLNLPKGEDAALFLATKMREMGDYIAENFKEFV